jgi:hypothetical protein
MTVEFFFINLEGLKMNDVLLIKKNRDTDFDSFSIELVQLKKC